MDWRTLFRSEPLRVPSDPCDVLPRILTDALRAGMGPAKAEPAASDFVAIRADELLNIDQRLRSYRSDAYRHWALGTLHAVGACPLVDDVRSALLFIACSHPDGRERQKAVWRLAEFPGYLTLAAALVRCADWAAPVRFAARDAVVQLLSQCDPDEVVSAWPLVLRLKQRERSGEEWLVENVDCWMLAPGNREALHLALESRTPSVRRWAYQQAVARGDDILLPALLQPDPRIGLHALRHAGTTLGAKGLGDLAAAGLKAPHPVIRRESLRALATTDNAAAAAALPRALLDRSVGVRRLAAFLTRQSGSDPREAWRAALDHPSVPFPLGALASLAEEPENQDAGRMRRLLLADRPIVRQLALKGLLKTGESVSPDEFSKLLELGGRRVLAALNTAVCDSAICLDSGLIQHVLASDHVGEAGRIAMRKLLNTGGLWDRLDQLLGLRIADSDFLWWLTAADDWIRRSEAYAPLGDVRKRALLSALTDRVSELGADRSVRITDALRRY
ncbi:hypothetical protein ACFFGH_15955 [Lysobacter korlensis]|uniref:HEAT repeat domain-containing protein n=1 Tax=Lysobacter korlensis TaxID=553636 RepID=A0ABV6RRY4_9GAMM